MSEIHLTSFESTAIYGVLVIAVISLVYAYMLFRDVMSEDKGTEAMIRIWTAVKDGADAYLGQQLRTILPFVGILVFALFGSVWIAPPTPEAVEMFGDNARITIAIGRSVAFILGALFSLMSASSACAWPCRATCASPPPPCGTSVTHCASPTAPAPSPAC
jgi:K(+)-stimulated pyrophosphate-energized sodium pump